MGYFLVKELFAELDSKNIAVTQKRPEYLEWLGPNLTGITKEFVKRNRLSDSYFVKRANSAFKTNHFENLLNRWIVEYFFKFFNTLDDFLVSNPQLNKALELEDNPLHRFGAEKYYSRFGVLPKIQWKGQPCASGRSFSIFLRCLIIFYHSLDRGMRLSYKRKRYVLMREAIWGLHDIQGYYFHDDFLVDGNKIKKDDLLLFSRGVPIEEGRLKGYQDTKRSSYAHFDLMLLPIGINSLFFRIIPKYILLFSFIFFREISSRHFSLYWSIYLYFAYTALPYEKVFSHFKIISELGHNYFSISHIPEAIVCQNNGAKYYLMHWSDNSLMINSYLLSFLACDSFLLWGEAHAQCLKDVDAQAIIFTGYPFKSFIKKVMLDRHKILREMGISAKGKIVSFFDEAFGGHCKMTEEHYVTIWETASRLAETEKGVTVLLKPKWRGIHEGLSGGLKNRFLDIKNSLEKMQNVYLLDADAWSFIEVIGVSDIVVTQGMTSSATIAIICGIEGLYLDQAKYNHPFSKLFKDRIVFDDPEKLLSMIQKIVKGTENPLSDIPEDVLRAYDAYDDDRGIGMFRDILTNNRY